jgi:hypothetical protein
MENGNRNATENTTPAASSTRRPYRGTRVDRRVAAISIKVTAPTPTSSRPGSNRKQAAEVAPDGPTVLVVESLGPGCTPK